ASAAATHTSPASQEKASVSSGPHARSPPLLRPKRPLPIGTRWPSVSRSTATPLPPSATQVNAKRSPAGENVKSSRAFPCPDPDLRTAPVVTSTTTKPDASATASSCESGDHTGGSPKPVGDDRNIVAAPP